MPSNTVTSETGIRMGVAMRVAQRVSQFLCIVCVLLICCALSAQNKGHRVRNIVLVHGAWADGSGWKGVYDILVKDGYNVSIVQEPKRPSRRMWPQEACPSLQDGPSILVAHSYGGSVITEAGSDPSVAGLVYVAAHMPDAGEKRVERRKAFPKRPRQIGRHKENPGRFHLYRPGAIS